MKEFIKTSFIMMVFFMLMAVNTYAEVPNMAVKSWCADDMAVGNTTGYNGLEFMLPVGGTADNGIVVAGDGRMYDAEHDYDNAIKTRGAANTGVNYVPKGRAMKFTVTQPCDLVVYAYDASSSADVSLQISRAGKIVDTIPLSEKINRYAAYLDTAGTYYVYSIGGSMGVCEMQVGYVKGDLDFDFDVTWNDVRLMRKKVLNYGIGVSSNHKFDIDGDGYYRIKDFGLLEELVSEPEKIKCIDAISQRPSNGTWNMKDVPTTNPITYNGLEFVYKDLNTANNTIKIANIPKTYVSPNGNEKSFTKCVTTDGKMSAGKGIYPVTKAVKFNLNASAQIVVYMCTGSSNTNQQKALIINADGEIVEEVNLSKDIGKYAFDLNGNETYFIGSPEGTLRIYEIGVRMVLQENTKTSKTISVTANNKYNMFLTVDTAVLPDINPVKLTYNASALSIESIGGSKPAVGICNDGTKILEVGQGYIVFMADRWNDGESGIMTDVTVKAKTSGQTTLSLEV